MAYVSGDLQGSIETSWAWQGAEIEDRASPGGPNPFIAVPSHSHGTTGPPNLREGFIEWSGWEGIMDTLGQLAQESGPQASHSREHGDSAPQGNALQLVSPTNSQPSKAVSLNSSRISIANII